MNQSLLPGERQVPTGLDQSGSIPGAGMGSWPLLPRMSGVEAVPMSSFLERVLTLLKERIKIQNGITG